MYFNCIHKHILKSHYKLYISIEFKITFMTRILIQFYRTPVFAAVKKCNAEIVKLLLTNNNLDVNIKSILKIFYL